MVDLKLKPALILVLMIGILLSFSLAACSALKPPATPTPSPLVAQGRKVFLANCSRCHGTNSDTVIVGPSLAGVATRAATRREGFDAPAYIRDSILNPGAYTVEGFPEGIMPPDISSQLTAEDLDAVIAYLLTLQ